MEYNIQKAVIRNFCRDVHHFFACEYNLRKYYEAHTMELIERIEHSVEILADQETREKELASLISKLETFTSETAEEDTSESAKRLLDEARKLYDPETLKGVGQYVIYQMRDINLWKWDDKVEAMMNRSDTVIKAENYDAVYTGLCPKGKTDREFLRLMDEYFCLTYPPDYMGNMFCPPDVVVIARETGRKAYILIDNFKYAEIPEFMKELSNIENDMEIPYEKVGDYYLPRIEPRFKPDRPLGMYGRMRKAFLEENFPDFYHAGMLSDDFMRSLYDTDEEADRKYHELMKQLEEKNPAPDKAADGLAWARHMTGLQEQAREIVLHELIYTLP